jgi:tetratricopeptide (TPR) repeat protein
MDSARLEALVLRLVQNPHDEAAIAEAHAEGQRDPKAYAVFLERVGAATSDPALASYWLTEAANVWHSALADAHRAARTLMLAIDRDPLQPVPAERLAELYRQKGDNKALAALLERRAKALLPMAAVDVPVREQLAAIFEELGRLWSEPPLATPEKAIEHFRQAIEYDPGNEYAIYTLRELLKGQGALQEALPYYELERALTQDGERKLALFADEGELRQRLGDWDGAAEAFRRALSLDPNDPTTRQQLATLVLEKARAGANPSAAERDEAVRLFVGLTLEFGGEHGFLYAQCALELTPDHDAAFEQACSLGQQLGRLAELVPHAAAYLQANPRGKYVATAQSLTLPAATQQAALAEPPAVAPFADAGAAPADDDSMTVVDEAGLEALRERSHLAGESAPDPVVAATPQAPAVAAPAAVTPEAPAVEMQASAFAEPVAPPSVQQPLVEQSPLEALLSKAAGLAAKNRKNEAYKFYREALDLSPAEPEALAFVETHLKRIRKFGELRDLLWVASKAAGPGEPATSWLREVASLCETQLRDAEGAIEAWQRIFEFDPDTARSDLKRLLTAAGRWDALAQVLSQEADQALGAEARVALEKEPVPVGAASPAWLSVRPNLSGAR